MAGRTWVAACYRRAFGVKTDCYSHTGLFETVDSGAHSAQLTVG
jgi:hypothetical protein